MGGNTVQVVPNGKVRPLLAYIHERSLGAGSSVFSSSHWLYLEPEKAVTWHYHSYLMNCPLISAYKNVAKATLVLDFYNEQAISCYALLCVLIL